MGGWGERGGNEGNMKTQHGSEGSWVACNTPPPPELECKNRVLKEKKRKENEKKKTREKKKSERISAL